ncbi:MAG: transglutaminase-like cysteine peptidase [Kiloniellales bacterium]
MPRQIRKRHLASAAMLAVLLGAAPAAQALSYPPLFGTNEARSNNIAMFPKWRGTLDRYFEEMRLPEDCAPGLMSQCLLQDWKTFLDSQQGQDPMAQLSAVNAEMNRRRYILDPPNWGVPDYWATPLQFMEKNGDCEDYAIAKFMSLRALGWSNESMRIVVLKDLNLQLMHAVLVVYHEGQALVLDNQIDQVMPAERIRHYRPIYSLNEDSWWLHRS